MDKKANSKKKSTNKINEKYQKEIRKANIEIGEELLPKEKKRRSGVR
ncbi:hypothetical protein [Clostridium thermopalmarium]|nr:hypothetical protein [Clostridium thermopalmarium]